MDPVPATLLTATVATLGRWSRGKTVDVRLVVGVVFMATALALVSQANRPLARAFGALIVVTTLLAQGQAITKKLGLSK